MKRFGVVLAFLAIFGVSRWFSQSGRPSALSVNSRTPSSDSSAISLPSAPQLALAPRAEGTSAIAREMRRGRTVVRALNASDKTSPSPLQKLAREAKSRFQMEGKEYRWLPELRTAPLESFHPSDGTPLEFRGNQIIFQAHSDGTGNANVVYNATTRNLGLVTGALSVKWVDAHVKEALSQEYRLSPIQSFDHLGLTFYQSGSTELPALLALYDRLKQDGRVSEVTLQILEHVARPQ